jgi:hypothetical protein
MVRTLGLLALCCLDDGIEIPFSKGVENHNTLRLTDKLLEVALSIMGKQMSEKLIM